MSRLSKLEDVARKVVERPQEVALDLDYARYLEEFELGQRGFFGHEPMSRRDFETNQQFMADPVFSEFIRILYQGQ